MSQKRKKNPVVIEHLLCALLSKPLGYIIEQNQYPCPQEAYVPAWFPCLQNANNEAHYEVIFRRNEVMCTKYVVQCLTYNKHTINCSF